MQMTIARWTPPVAPTRQEQFLLKRLGRVRKLLGFLRLHRHELFDDAFQEELASIYRTTGAGKDALAPAMMAMAMLVQGYLGMSDAEMIELTIVDLRVQMVLGCLGAEAPPFSQGALQERRDRFESTGGRGTGRGHLQLAGPCGQQRGPVCGRPARVARREGVYAGGHSAARGVEYQEGARYRLERGGREGPGAPDLFAATRCPAVVDRPPTARRSRQAAAPRACRDPRADP